MGRAKHGKRAFQGGFLALPHMLLNHPKFHGLSSSAVKLLVDLAKQVDKSLLT
jgi:hypothetical protein